MALAASQVALTALSTYHQAKSTKQLGRYKQQTENENADFLDIQAKDAILRGDRASNDLKLKTKGLIGRQRAAMAAQGIDIGDGSALDIQEDTAGQGAMDALTIKNNAWRESFGFGMQARARRRAGSLEMLAAKNEANATLLTGGLKAVEQGVGGYDRFQKAKGTKNQWV